MRGFEDIGSKGHFQPKRGGLGSKNPPRGIKNFLGGQNNIKKTQHHQITQNANFQNENYMQIQIGVNGGQQKIFGSK